MEVSLAKRLILSVSMHGGRYFFIQPFLFFPFLFQTDAKEAAPVGCLQRGQGNFELVTNSDYDSRGSADPREKSA